MSAATRERRAAPHRRRRARARARTRTRTRTRARRSRVSATPHPAHLAQPILYEPSQ
ncbi:hypothetical protein MYA_5888 [Burkholderia sp. KJ006]|nr:hypothetical protein MYA_5888 [Burkholderia sp. KJ006]